MNATSGSSISVGSCSVVATVERLSVGEGRRVARGGETNARGPALARTNRRGLARADARDGAGRVVTRGVRPATMERTVPMATPISAMETMPPTPTSSRRHRKRNSATHAARSTQQESKVPDWSQTRPMVVDRDPPRTYRAQRRAPNRGRSESRAVLSPDSCASGVRTWLVQGPLPDRSIERHNARVAFGTYASDQAPSGGTEWAAVLGQLVEELPTEFASLSEVRRFRGRTKTWFEQGTAEEEALSAARRWPEDGDDAMDRLSVAVREGVGGRGIVAALIEAYATREAWNDVLAAARMPPSDRCDEDSVAIECDRLDAVEETIGPAACDEAWERAKQRLSGASPELSALGHQRRGVLLAGRGDLKAARTAFLSAARQYAKVPNLAGEAADSWQAWRKTLELCGRMLEVDQNELRLAVAAGVASPSHPDSIAADEREAEGLRARAIGNFASARTKLWEAFILRRRRGHLLDSTRLLWILAALHDDAGEKAVATALYVEVGAERQAGEVAADVGALEVVDDLRVRRERWARAATWGVLARRGAEVKPQAAEELARAVLDDARLPLEAWIAPNPPWSARGAVAGMFCAIDPRDRTEALEILREGAASAHPELARPATRALGQSTVLGWSDERELLLRIFDDEGPGGVAVGSETLAEWLADSAYVDTFRNRAKGGSAVLQLFVLAGVVVRDRALVDACDAAARAVVSSTVTTSENFRSVSLGSGYEAVGIIARAASDDARAQAETSFRTLATSTQEMSGTRASALNALFNMSVEGKTPQRRTIDLVVDDGAFDAADESLRPPDHPFSRMRMQLSTGIEVQVARTSLLARWAQHGHISAEVAWRHTFTALSSEDSALVVAGLDGLTRLHLLFDELSLEGFAGRRDARVRAATVAAVLRRGSPSRDRVLSKLSADRDPRVRAGFLRDDAPQPMLNRLADDRNAWIRARSRTLVKK